MHVNTVGAWMLCGTDGVVVEIHLVGAWIRWESDALVRELCHRKGDFLLSDWFEGKNPKSQCRKLLSN